MPESPPIGSSPSDDDAYSLQFPYVPLVLVGRSRRGASMHDSQQQPRNLPLHASHAINSLLLRRRGREHHALRGSTRSTSQTGSEAVATGVRARAQASSVAGTSPGCHGRHGSTKPPANAMQWQRHEQAQQIKHHHTRVLHISENEKTHQSMFAQFMWGSTASAPQTWQGAAASRGASSSLSAGGTGAEQ